MSGITTHVLDTSLGRPGAGVAVTLSASDGEDWREVRRTTTDADGRASLTDDEESTIIGDYRVCFAVADYFAARSTESFYPFVEIHFTVADPSEHYHVPLLLSPFGYSTYRGS